MTVTFEICDVVRASQPLFAGAVQRAVRGLLGTPVEACGADVDTLIDVQKNAFVSVAWRAYQGHHPLVLTPDAVWLCIAQGFALHVNHHAEQLRGRFVRHKGRLPLFLKRDDFVKGRSDNPWPEVFAAFSQQIAGHIGRQRDLVVCDFSTTGPIERATSEIVLMDAMQRYFEYTMMTVCGIPEITLTGTVDDWRSIRRRAGMLAEYGLEWWTSTLLPILDQFVAAASGRPDIEFWRHIFKYSSRDGSGGGSFLHGWILLFFPYFIGSPGRPPHVNPILEQARGASPVGRGGGVAAWVSQAEVSPSGLPQGLSCAPLEWVYLGRSFPMDLIGGFVGIAQDPHTLALRPAIGWAVRDRMEQPVVRDDSDEEAIVMTVPADPFGSGNIVIDSDDDEQEPADADEPAPWLAGALIDDDDSNA